VAIEEKATQLSRAAEHGAVMPTARVGGLVLEPGEVAYADVICGTARYYATYPVVPPEAGYFEVHPAFGRRWVSNRRLNNRRRQEAEAVARLQWRDHTVARVVLTSVGLRVCPSGNAEWLPFDHSLLTGMTDSGEEDGVVLTYDCCPPLLLTGPAAAPLADTIKNLMNGQ
jgi:hypothetical protein